MPKLTSYKLNKQLGKTLSDIKGLEGDVERQGIENEYQSWKSEQERQDTLEMFQNVGQVLNIGSKLASKRTFGKQVEEYAKGMKGLQKKQTKGFLGIGKQDKYYNKEGAEITPEYIWQLGKNRDYGIKEAKKHEFYTETLMSNTGLVKPHQPDTSEQDMYESISDAEKEFYQENREDIESFGDVMEDREYKSNLAKKNEEILQKTLYEASNLEGLTGKGFSRDQMGLGIFPKTGGVTDKVRNLEDIQKDIDNRLWEEHYGE